METGCLLLRLGQVDYQEAWDFQRRLVDARLRRAIGDTLVLLEHPHVYTLGSRGDEANVLRSAEELGRLGARLYRSDRGGDATYHGPGQLVGYPILDLRGRGLDVHRYVRDLEETLIRALSDFGIQAGREAGHSGVWVGAEKIAAIGVRVSRWITSHGFALNVCPDLSYFSHIVPCGIRGRGVTSMSQLLDRAVGLEESAERVASRFGDVFACAVSETSLQEIERLASM